MASTIGSLKRLATGSALAVGLLCLSMGPAMAQDDSASRTFADTGYTIGDDAIWNFFTQYGGATTFGEPISREFMLFGKQVQLFQDAALQVLPDGSVSAMQLTDPGLVPTTQLDGLSVPPADAAVAFVTPTPDQPNYSARLQVFLQSTVPDVWNQLPVQFGSTYNSEGGVAVWGLPTSQPKADPHNPSFIYQRFQNGIMFYDASAGTTAALPLGEYLKTQLTTDSPLLKTAATTNSDLTDAFVPDAA
jgi:hypothetical protein